MSGIRGLTVVVGAWYARTHAICAARNMRHLVETVVVTDAATAPLLADVPGQRVHVTDAFTRADANGAVPLFNKGLAIEEAWPVLGRHGWLLVLDGDVLLPDYLPAEGIRPGTLYGARRRILADPAAWHPGLDWSACEPVNDGGQPIGFCQLFHAADPALAGVRPWYDVTYPHAGGGDAAFMARWPAERRALLPMEVLHLGPIDTHWYGSDEAGKALMAALVNAHHWHRSALIGRPEAAARAASLPGRLVVPGYEPSTFRLPFERP
jgi:hypothetical protein